MLVVGGLALRVASKASGVHAELGRHVPSHTFRHVGGLGKEGAQESHRTELNCKAHAVVVAAADGRQAPVSVREVEVAGELLGRRLASEAPVGKLLLLG